MFEKFVATRGAVGSRLKTMRRSLLLLVSASWLTVGCTSDSGANNEPLKPVDDDHPGAMIFRSTIDDGNSFTCSTCHAIDEPADDGLRRPGHALRDAAARPSYKNGEVASLREAVNSCLTEWMNAEPWEADDARWVDLEGFLQDIAPSSAPALTYEIRTDEIDLEGGDADDGRELFNGSCAVCHGQNGGGTDQAPPVVGFGHAADYVARRVRTSGRGDSSVYQGLTGGIMPFFSDDRLSDAELRDLVAYLGERAGAASGGDDGNTSAGDDGNGSGDDGNDSGAADDGNDSGADDGNDSGAGDGNDSGAGDSGDSGNGDDSGGDTGSGCGMTSPKIGWTASLSNLFHDVSGTAEIIDDCTVEIRNFNYDGTGIDVRVYGGLDGDYDNGFAMTDDLLLPGGYQNEVIEATLPAGMTMDDLDGVSIWCVTVGIDFGSGTFAP